jgi:hypothetical protein
MHIQKCLTVILINANNAQKMMYQNIEQITLKRCVNMTEIVQKTLKEERPQLQLVRLGGKKIKGEANAIVSFLMPLKQGNLPVKIVKNAETKTVLHTMKITTNPLWSIGCVNLAINNDTRK